MSAAKRERDEKKRKASTPPWSNCGRDKRGYRPPPKSGIWATRWDKKCESDFVDYVPPTNARLS